MKINTKARYGTRAILELALNDTQEGVYQKDISINQDISYKYLDQIICGLKAGGLIGSVSGKKSGYRLTRNPSKITVYDIYNAFNHNLAVVDCLADKRICSKHEKCAARDLWSGLNSVIESYLKSKTIDDLVKKQHELENQNEGLTYQI